MAEFLVSILYLARPLLSIKLDWSPGGLSVFEAATIALTALLGLAAASASLGSEERRGMSRTEWWMLAFAAWCTASFFFHYDVSVFKSYIKWLLPLATFVVLRRVLQDRAALVKRLPLTIAAFSIPIGLSVAMIARGRGVAEEVFATGFVRYQGAYNGAHEMAHSVGFLLMSLAVYVALAAHAPDTGARMSRWRYLAFGALAAGALYCVYYSQTRTVILGLFVFVVVYLYKYSRVLLGAFLGAIAVSALLWFSVYAKIFYDVVTPEGEATETMEKAGSGRPKIWKHNLEVVKGLDWSERLAGVGIGNWAGNRSGGGANAPPIYNSHNDWFQVSLDTGLIGLALMVGIYASLFRSILRLAGPERHAFLALLLAVTAMNFMSNSYLSRVPIAQLLMMVLVYAELPPPRRREEAPEPVSTGAVGATA